MRRALVWLNVYGREAVRHKLWNSQKTQKMYFLPVFELMSDSLTTIYRMRAILSRSWLQAALEYKPYIRTEFSEKKLLKNKEMVFRNGVKYIQAAAYNGVRTVCYFRTYVIKYAPMSFLTHFIPNTFYSQLNTFRTHDILNQSFKTCHSRKSKISNSYPSPLLFIFPTHCWRASR